MEQNYLEILLWSLLEYNYWQLLLNPLAAEFIYLATSADCANRPTAVKG